MAKDPVCGMQVSDVSAPATSEYQGKTYFFCSEACKAVFDRNPAKFVQH